MSYLVLGPLRIRTSTRYLAKWGFPVIGIGGLDLFSRSNTGDLILASYHPRKCITWHWSVSIGKRGGKCGRAAKRWRQNQWYDYYWLPFGYRLIVAQQDYHKWSHRSARSTKERADD